MQIMSEGNNALSLQNILPFLLMEEDEENETQNIITMVNYGSLFCNYGKF